MAFTFFFRDINVINAAVKAVMPNITGRSRAYIWDAGCAMGQEPYTLAIVLAENMGHFAFGNIRILASDYDEGGNFEKIIADGVYGYEELKRIPEGLFKKYFTPFGEKSFRVIDMIRESVQFVKHDLLTLKPVKENVSLILCKNVLLHINESQRLEVIKMFHGALSAGGRLGFENTQKMPDKISELFERQDGDAVIYTKKDISAVLA
jgi:chemotaxis protein methyltransferase CheR